LRGSQDARLRNLYRTPLSYERRPLIPTVSLFGASPVLPGGFFEILNWS
jgi:hypothetical protein